MKIKIVERRSKESGKLIARDVYLKRHWYTPFWLRVAEYGPTEMKSVHRDVVKMFVAFGGIVYDTEFH